jgi:hypothetical protein
MKQSIRKTPSSLLLAYKYGDGQDSLVGRNFSLEAEGETLTLGIDLTPNFHARNRAAPSYSDAVNLVHNHDRLHSLQCGDNLLRARLDRSWDRVRQPHLRLRLELGGRGSYLYRVAVRALFTGGIQLDVQDALPADGSQAYRNTPPPGVHHIPGNTA